MNYFVIRVSPRSEEKFLQLSHAQLKMVEDEQLFFPRRKLTQWRGGKKREVEIPLFPGYVFYRSESVNPDQYWALKRTGGFLQFLKTDNHFSPLMGGDLELLKHFLSFGEVIDKSKVYFDLNQRIHVTKGPLMGMEGKITRVDRRKGRAKVQVDFQGNTFVMDLAFEDIGTSPLDRVENP